jgi:type IV pilus biogenesis protein CpaD/CtpE
MLMMKRVNEVAARMILVTLKPGMQLNLEEASMYIILDGQLRVSEHDQMQKILMSAQKRSSNFMNSKLNAGKLNKFKAAANSFMQFKRISNAIGVDDELLQASLDAATITQGSLEAGGSKSSALKDGRSTSSMLMMAAKLSPDTP